MKTAKNLVKLFVGLFVSIAILALLVRKILQFRTSRKLVSTDTNDEKASLKKKLSDVKKEVEIIKKVETTKPKKKVGGLTGLNDRQSLILKTFKKGSTVSMEEIEKLVSGVNVRTLRRDLSELSDKGIITKSGSTKGVTYKIEKD